MKNHFKADLSKDWWFQTFQDKRSFDEVTERFNTQESVEMWKKYKSELPFPISFGTKL